MFNNRNTSGTANPMSRLSLADIDRLKDMKGKESSKSAAKLLGVSVRTVQIYWQHMSLSSVKEHYEESTEASYQGK